MPESKRRSSSSSSTSSILDLAKQKRHRVAVVCLNCRKKKIKCDKSKPDCNNCVKSNIKCQYQDVTWASSTVVDPKGNVSSSNDYSYQNVFSLSDKYILNDSDKDMQVNNIDKAITFEQQNRTTIHNNYTKKISLNINQNLLENHPQIDANETIDFYENAYSNFAKYEALSREGPFSWALIETSNLLPKDTISDDKDIDFTQKFEQIHLRPRYKNFPSQQLIDLILYNMPKKKLLWLLIDHFFKTLYIMMPYLDMDFFLKEVCRLLDSNSNDLVDQRFMKINISKKSDYLTVALLFIILRFSFISVSDNTESNSYIVNNPISAQLISVAKVLISEFKIFDETSFELLQAYLYLRLYNHYSPECGDNTGGADSPIFHGTLLSMAVSLGFHRDPGDIAIFKHNKALCNLRRRVWFCLILGDLYQTVSLGNQTVSTFNLCNVKLPEISPEDTELNQKINSCFREYCEDYHVISDIISQIADLNKKIKVIDVIKNIAILDGLRTENYKSMKEFVQDEPKDHSSATILRRLIRLIRYSFCNSFCFTLEYNIFLHYENSPEGKKKYKKICQYYLSKMLKRSLESITNLPNLLTSISKYFRYGINIVQLPAILLALRKAVQLQNSFSLRCQHLIKVLELKGNADKIELINYLKLIIRSISLKIEYYLSSLNNACDTYYYAWRMKRPHMLFWLVSKQDFYVIKDSTIALTDLDADTYKKYGINVSQDSILEDMTLEDFKNLFPISNEEMEKIQRHEKYENNGDVLGRMQSQYTKEDKSPRIENLLNDPNNGHPKRTGLVDSSLSFMMNLMDSNIDHTWIKMYYGSSTGATATTPNAATAATTATTATVTTATTPTAATTTNTTNTTTNNKSADAVNYDQKASSGFYANTQFFNYKTGNNNNDDHSQPAQQSFSAPYVGPNSQPNLGQQSCQRYPQSPEQPQQQPQQQHHYQIQPQPHQAQSAFYHQGNGYSHATRKGEDVTTTNNNFTPDTNFDQFFNLIGTAGFNTLDDMFGNIEFSDN
ncbi:hypothetical protein PACTADRAFT_3115 [Pachysolen tannophilus NRRL Y-2460]|uniref:Zn(2)-C6 fungal-type domain-containing protein n=1 Tax=Pachysolen tannophilus NRRL Y-2460 TaxID=669874 RepID=A0A1E4TUK1_PACTA|nr:hypothetical protein PACTADRAFT_3115 [Pachysolen tannophilus NRRL Y-2460]